MAEAVKLLEVHDLTVSFPTPDGVVQAVRGISFAVERGRTLGIVGESGSGKSVSTQTIVGLTRGARVSGKALFNGRNLLELDGNALRQVRGAEIGMIFQDPLSSLHPYYRVGWQIEEMIRAHEDVGRKAARRRAIELLGLVGIPRPERRVDDYPHQFSGGMLQRAMIAMAIALSPRLLIADEPTTALDVTVQAQIIELMKRLQSEFGTAIIMITHDLGVIADTADDVMVMYAGRAMERAPRRALYYRPHHPYTDGLLRSLPRLDAEEERLTPIAGQPPSLIDPPAGCPFHPRCPYAMARCVRETPPLRNVLGDAGAADDDAGHAPAAPDANQAGDAEHDGLADAHRSACWLPLELLGTGSAVDEARRRAADAAGRAATATAGVSGTPGAAS